MSVVMTRTLSIPEPATQKKFYASSAYTSGGAQEEIYLPDTNYVGVSLVLVSAGTGRVELTTSTPDQVDAGTADWITSAIGDVTASTFAVLYGATAIRVFRTSGQWRINVRC